MPSKVEPIVLLLFGAMVFFTVCLFIAEKWFGTDGQLFQVISGLLTGIAGAFLMRVKPNTSDKPPAIEDPQRASVTTITQETTAK
jgi:hypothetical protein